ncbi:DUF4402 domain-containing protein [Qipengyuania soli]|uniref:DUF4402 domain-containing protein n=1 Tax=Qipengyuania soli TaxID=2782568 RepID=A0A7S8F4D8_9SPHN|nr:DUF4402 domain-containing protein [Qipengyuania soli]QPC98903.1 DUF4402 domain-containing protein [Qipengyuania soli]
MEMRGTDLKKRGRLRMGQIGVMATLLLATGPAPAFGAPSTISVTNPLMLRFGTFAVPSSGFREVSASGAVSSAGIFALSSAGTGPARFTLQYDRGNNSKRRVDVTIDLVFSTPSAFAQGGLTARLSRYQSDIPGYPSIAPGQIVRVQLDNCLQRVCSMSFNLGGRLDVDRSFGGGNVAIPIPVDAVLVSER